MFYFITTDVKLSSTMQKLGISLPYGFQYDGGRTPCSQSSFIAICSKPSVIYAPLKAAHKPCHFNRQLYKEPQ